MQSKIKLLSPHEAIKIAAGEVIERPANIIKELIENSIDAGAKNISLYLSKAGKDLIKIVDDGSGMTPEDAKLCFSHHATSKITSVQDLNIIHTYGFRGEALSSIAAISHTELITKTEDQKVATKIVFKHSECIQEEQASHPTGTTFIIKDLFDNVPARKKFLKSDDTEWNQIISIFQAFCLRYLDINFKLFHNDYLSYNCTKTDNIQTRTAQLWQNNLHEQLIAIPEKTIKNITISGALSTPHYYRYNRGQIFIFVNNRWVKNHELMKGILEGYQGVLPHQKYPAVFLNIQIDQNLIDINIHPKKEEIKFLNPGIAQQIVTTIVKETLNNFIHQKIAPQNITKTSIDHKIISEEKNNINITSFEKKEPYRSPFNTIFKSPFTDSKNIVIPKKESAFIPQKPVSSAPLEIKTFITKEEENDSFIDQNDLYSIIGQFNKTYIILEQNNELILVDQHAAHERIIYQRLKLQGESASVQLMFPHIIKMTQENVQKIVQQTYLLSEQGIIIDQLSDIEIIITATPIGMQAAAVQEIIIMLIDLLDAEVDISDIKIKDKVIISKACKTACKAGDTLDLTQMQNIIKELLKTPDKFSCPHGRPTMYPLALKEIEKHFKRDYVGTKEKNITLV